MASPQGNRETPRLRLVRIERTPGELLDLEYAEGFAALVVRKGMRPRRFYKVAEGEMHPGRISARLMDDAYASGVSCAEIINAITAPLRRYAMRRYRVALDAAA